jgi:hypothetical protein
LFTIRSDGTVAEVLEGAFGVEALERAVDRAVK